MAILHLARKNNSVYSSKMFPYPHALTQKSLLFENVLIDICKQRISCAIVVVIIVDGHAVSSFAL